MIYSNTVLQKNLKIRNPNERQKNRQIKKVEAVRKIINSYMKLNLRERGRERDDKRESEIEAERREGERKMRKREIERERKINSLRLIKYKNS